MSYEERQHGRLSFSVVWWSKKAPVRDWTKHQVEN